MALMCFADKQSAGSSRCVARTLTIEQQFAFERERALLIEQMELHAARAEGEAAGIFKGEAAGLQKALARMIASGMPEAQARQILGLGA